MSDDAKKEEAFLEELVSVTEEILKEIDEAVKRIIKYYRNELDIATNIQDDKDIQLLIKYPREALQSFYKILDVDKKVPHEVPSHLSNNSKDIFSSYSKLTFPKKNKPPV